MTTKSKTILLAEDDRFISRAYSDGLTRAGYQVIVAGNGVEALAKIRSENPGLVLLDIIMPDKNGFEVLEEMKLDPKLKTIPVIILSNLGQDSDIAQGKKLGVAGYLVKSNTSMKEVIEKVAAILARPNLT